MCAPSPPAPPDYAAAAREQGAANIDAAVATGQINNPNVINPYGTQQVTWQGHQPTLTQTFSPEQQRLYETQTQVRQLLGGLGVQGAEALGGVLGRNLDLSGLPAQPGTGAETRDRVIQAMMTRGNEDLARTEDERRSQLVAAGHQAGDKGYEAEMDRINRARTDLRTQAELAAGQEVGREYGIDSQRRQQGLAEMLAGRQTPLNEITALMSGSQVSNPFAGGLGYQAGANVQAAPLFGAAQARGQSEADLYNAQAGAQGAMMSGLFSGLGTFAGGKWSDRRLKRNVVRIGTHPLGIGLYEFDYVWGGHAVGVMADEVRTVMPGAVGMVGGYDFVDYGMLG